MFRLFLRRRVGRVCIAGALELLVYLLLWKEEGRRGLTDFCVDILELFLDEGEVLVGDGCYFFGHDVCIVVCLEDTANVQW